MPFDPPPPYDSDESVLKPLSPLAAALERASLEDLALVAIALHRASPSTQTVPTPSPHRSTSSPSSSSPGLAPLARPDFVTAHFNPEAL